MNELPYSNVEERHLAASEQPFLYAYLEYCISSRSRPKLLKLFKFLFVLVCFFYLGQFT